MMPNKESVHEPEAELLSAEDAVQDAARLRLLLRRKSEHWVPLRVPLSALLEALDALEPKDLQQAVHHAQERIPLCHNV
jgi:hypothetical protein